MHSPLHEATEGCRKYVLVKRDGTVHRSFPTLDFRLFQSETDLAGETTYLFNRENDEIFGSLTPK